MKKAIFLILVSGLFTAAQAQNARIDKSGNYMAYQRSAMGGDSTATGKTFTDTKGETFPVFLNYKGKLYYIRTSKAGKVYRAYLKLEADKKE